MPPDPLVVLRFLAETLEGLGIPYLIGGSIASSVFGEFRATQDVDFAVDMTEAQAPNLAAALEGAFYVDEGAIREAIRSRTSFNVIHLATMYKADVFVLPDDAIYRDEMARRRLTPLPFGDELVPVYVASPEDTILQKRKWFRMGGGVSDRQWRDVLGILKVQAGELDLAYMHKTAARLHVVDLLDAALRDAAGTEP